VSIEQSRAGEVGEVADTLLRFGIAVANLDGVVKEDPNSLGALPRNFRVGPR
jgi:hypothetical protein